MKHQCQLCSLLTYRFDFATMRREYTCMVAEKPINPGPCSMTTDDIEGAENDARWMLERLAKLKQLLSDGLLPFEEATPHVDTSELRY